MKKLKIFPPDISFHSDNKLEEIMNELNRQKEEIKEIKKCLNDVIDLVDIIREVVNN